MLKDRIQEDMVKAMKSQDKDTLSVLRMLKGAMQLESINKGLELSDEVVISVISREIKQRNESIKEFESAGRTDLADSTKKEIEVLNKYLPEALSEEEVNKIIDEAFALIKPEGAKDMGKIMKEVTLKLKGRADMSLVSSIIKGKLG